MKPGPVLAMVGLLFLGVYLVWNRPSPLGNVALRPGAMLFELRIAQSKGVIERVRAEDGSMTFRVLMRDGHASEILSEPRLRDLFGDEVASRVMVQGQNSLFRVLNITGWTSLFWIALGLTGQVVFAGRTFVQWFVSERARRSVVPDLYWYMALVGAALLFAYFVWRRDVVGVLGQSTGVVIYARNVRLIRKQQRRDRAAHA